MSDCLQLLGGVDTSCLLAEIVSHLLVRQSCVVFSQLISCVNYCIPSGDTICGLVMERSSSGVGRSRRVLWLHKRSWNEEAAGICTHRRLRRIS